MSSCKQQLQQQQHVQDHNASQHGHLQQFSKGPSRHSSRTLAIEAHVQVSTGTSLHNSSGNSSRSNNSNSKITTAFATA
jgi:hypothetical protein